LLFPIRESSIIWNATIKKFQEKGSLNRKISKVEEGIDVKLIKTSLFSSEKEV
jgi:hypothetical protein